MQNAETSCSKYIGGMLKIQKCSHIRRGIHTHSNSELYNVVIKSDMTIH